MKTGIWASAALCALASTASLAASPGDNGFAKGDYTGFEQMELVAPAPGDNGAGSTAPTPLLAASIGQQRQSASFVPTSRVLASFEGVSQYDVASYRRNFIPPDTMGAVGTTQFSEFVNGGFAVFNKNGTVAKAQSDVAFWAAAGQTGANGDSRVLFNKAANRWVALSFGASVSDIQIAVSNTADATGTWQSTKFTGFAGGTADYPTLAMDTNAVYIGTNNFHGDGSFGGTTLNVIPLTSLFHAAPTTTGLKQFVTPYNSTTGGADGGFAIQGVNSVTATTTGHVETASLFYNDVIRYDIANAGTPGATKVNAQYLNVANYDGNGAARQPNAVPDAYGATHTSADPINNNRVVDTLDSRIGSNVWEVNGRIYSVYTVTPVGGDTTFVRYDVVDAATGKILDEGMIGDGHHDFWEGSINVNSMGQVVIAYNRSGTDQNITFAAEVFTTDGNGHLTLRGGENVLKVSLVDDYHNGSVDGFVAQGRQRWGDYSAVSLDPSNSRHFWVIGEFAREYNDAAGGHPGPGGTGGSRWSTWISEINVGTTVPEPATWGMMIAGFGLVGAMQRRRRTGYASA
nr:PEPxxWA-CTERM sorting domain-containing protein [Polymorphobacter sp.]